MKGQTTRALNPVSLPPVAIPGEGPRMSTLKGATVGLLSNNKPNADALLDRLGERLVELHGAHVRRYDKVVPSLEMPAALLARVVRECEGVVLAVYD